MINSLQISKEVGYKPKFGSMTTNDQIGFFSLPKLGEKGSHPNFGSTTPNGPKWLFSFF